MSPKQYYFNDSERSLTLFKRYGNNEVTAPSLPPNFVAYTIIRISGKPMNVEHKKVIKQNKLSKADFYQ